MKIKSIKIDNIELSNFMTFDKYKMSDLAEHNLIFICGKNAKGKSTITSECINFTLFNTSLRYNKIIDLLKWGYDVKKYNNDTYSKITFKVYDEYNKDNELSIKRNIINKANSERYSFNCNEDNNGIFDELIIANSIPSFNNALKNILEIDESIFSLLFLKSPYSQVIFDSNSELLAKITKADYINELRTDFINISNDIKSNISIISNNITKQKNLSESIKNQLSEIIDPEEIKSNKEKLEKVVAEITEYENEIKNIEVNLKKEKDRYNIFNDKIHELRILSNKYNVLIDQSLKEKEKINRLISIGKCPTCKQSISESLYSTEIENINAKIKENTDNNNLILERLNNGKKVIQDLEKEIDNISNIKLTLNNKIRNLSNIKSSLKQIIFNYNKNKKVNDDVLSNIRKTILDLNDELYLLDIDYKIISSISKVLLAKNSEYINIFYNNKIYNFTMIFKSVLIKLTNNKFYDVKILLNNKPILNENIEYKGLSTSERKIVDISFVISYIIYLSMQLKFKVFILDEFFDNYDKENILHIYKVLYDISLKYDLQLIITTNKSDYLLNNEITNNKDIRVIDLYNN